MLLQAGLVLVLVNALIVSGQVGKEVANLTNYLFSNYDVRIRPTNADLDATIVTVDFSLLAINDLNEATETMKVTGYLTLRWSDPYLVWKPEDFGDIQYYLWPQSTLWKPDVSLGNSILNYKALGIPTLNIEVVYNGEITWKPFEIFQSSCSFDITYFPFDIQNCSLDFIAWSYTKSEVKMESEIGINLEEFQPSSLWSLQGTDWAIEEDKRDSSIKFSFRMKRKPFFFILSIITPILLLGILNLFVFALPCESGERAGFSVTVFLALAVFLTIVSDNLPKNSDNVSIFSLYMVILTIQSTVITTVAMVTIRWSNNNENTPIPAWMLFLARITRCNRACKNKVSDNKTSEIESRNTNQTRNDKTNKTRDKVKLTESDDKHVDERTVGQIDGDIAKPRNSSFNQAGVTRFCNNADEMANEDGKPAYTWVEVVRALDIVFFIFFFSIFCLTTLISSLVCFLASG